MCITEHFLRKDRCEAIVQLPNDGCLRGWGGGGEEKISFGLVALPYIEKVAVSDGAVLPFAEVHEQEASSGPLEVSPIDLTVHPIGHFVFVRRRDVHIGYIVVEVVKMLLLKTQHMHRSKCTG